MEESYVHGMSVARVARKYGINANQVFQWRRLQQDGLLMPDAAGEAKLLPVRLIEEREPAKVERPEVALAAAVGTIHITLPGRVSIRLEGNVRRRDCSRGAEEPALLIGLPVGTRHLDRSRRDGYAARLSWAQRAGADPYLSSSRCRVMCLSFARRRGDIVKVLWFDGDGLCLLAKRLERGRFVWPQQAVVRYL